MVGRKPKPTAVKKLEGGKRKLNTKEPIPAKGMLDCSDWLLPWQEQLIRDIFGIVKPDGNRQFRTAFVEICKKVGKSELAAAVALYLLYADNEPSAEVYGAAADRQQASIVFDVAKQMVEMSPVLMKCSKLMGATKRIVNYSNAGYYQVLSAEVGGKHGFFGKRFDI